MQVAIMYDGFLDLTGTKWQIGGVETYLWHLARVCTDLGWGVTAYQTAASPFTTSIDQVRVVGVPPVSRHPQIRARRLYNYVRRHVSDGALLIFGSDHCSVRTDYPKAIAIQHGVTWDLAAEYLTLQPLLKHGAGAALLKVYLRTRAKRCFENCANRVCVDYNFLNWYRTVTSDPPKGRIWVITNFAILPKEDPVLPKTGEIVRVLFARRFVEYRGTRLIASAAHVLLKKYAAIRFTFAGEGPDEHWLRDQFSTEMRVQFTVYHPLDAVSVHAQHDIAVVPSLASEGTTFAVAEAMAAGCAVVASHVGGVTNMIIHNYNGLLIAPNASALTEALEDLITDPEKRTSLATAACRTAKAAFSYDRWYRSWRDVLQQVAANE